MSLLYALSQGLAGAAHAGAGMADQQLKEEAEARMADRRLSDQLRLDAAREAMAERAADRKQARDDAPLQRFGGLVKSYQGSEVPVTPDPVTSLSGQGTAFDGQPLKGPGLRGDIKKLREQVAAMPDGEDKQNILKQLANQEGADTKTAREAVAGKTRAVTTEEAVQMARDAALASDPVALAAYEKNIGKPARDDRRLDLQDKKNDSYQEFQVRRADRLDALQALKEAHEQSRQDRMDGKIDAAQEKNELNSRRSATVELMKSTEHELERAMALSKDALDPAMQKTYQARVERLTGDLSRYRAALETFSGDAVAPRETGKPSGTPPPDGTRGVYNGVPGVVKNGQFVPDKAVEPPKEEQPGLFNAKGAQNPMFKHDGAPDPEKVRRQEEAQRAFDAVGTNVSKAALLRSDVRKFSQLTPDQKQQIFNLLSGR